MKWMRFRHDGLVRFGVVEAGRVAVQDGDLFDDAHPAGTSLAIDEVEVLPPCVPTKIVGLWNNSRAAAEKNGFVAPAEPLYFLKSPGSAAAHGQAIPVPSSYDGRVVYEGELAIVIGRRTRAVSRDDAARHVFGYTCANDVTAVELLQRDPTFPQWTRAKSFDGFAAFGPVIETDFDVSSGSLRTIVGGRERQNYPFTDLLFDPLDLVSRISHDMTLEPGDVVMCGTSLGVLPMKPGTRVDVIIDGIGTLSNVYG